jgi:dimethylglycine catabolism B
MTVTALLVALSGVGILAQALLLARRWSRGAPADVNIAAGLARLPAAYFGAVHRVVGREPRASRMHVLAAGGTMATVFLVLAYAMAPYVALAGLTAIAAAAGCIGAILALGRRMADRPDRLSGGRYDHLPFALFGANLSLGVLVLGEAGVVRYPWPLAAVIALIGATALAWLVFMAGPGPMRHALAGLTSLVAHPRPHRLETPEIRDSALHLLNLDAEKLAPEQASDFAWNRLASFDACVQCGRCEVACPAYAAGQPLNPKALIADLVRASGTVIGHDYAGNPHPGLDRGDHPGPAGRLIAVGGGPAAVRPETLWSCTTCRACVEACPMFIEHVDAVIDLRRDLILQQGEAPPAVTRVLTELRETDTVAGRGTAARYNWAVDLRLPRLSDVGRCDVLLWVGETAFEQRNQTTLRALVRLLRLAGVDFAVLGEEERDCGDLARRLGDEATFQTLARATIDTLSRYAFGRILTADPHVLHCLGREYAALGAALPVVHHTVFLDELVAEGRLTPRRKGRFESVTYHDPCYLGRYWGEIDAPRRLLGRLGVARVEMRHHGMASRCCGGGGGAPIADIPGRRRVPDLRIDEANDTGAGAVIAACPYCTQMLEGVTGQRPPVVDIAELLLEALEERP